MSEEKRNEFLDSLLVEVSEQKAREQAEETMKQSEKANLLKKSHKKGHSK